MRRRISGSGISQAFALVFAVFFAVSALITGDLVAWLLTAFFVAAGVLPSQRVVRDRAEGRRQARLAGQSRDDVPEEFRRRAVRYPLLAAAAAVSCLAVGLLVGGAVGGPWGVVAGVWVGAAPTLVWSMRRTRTENSRIGDLVVARAPSMAHEELSALLLALEHRYGKTMADRIRCRLDAVAH